MTLLARLIHRNVLSTAAIRLPVALIAALALIPLAQAQASDQVLTWFGSQSASGTLGGQLDHPGAAAVNNTGAGPAAPGETYLPDVANNRIQRFDSEGNFIAAWGAGVLSGGSTYEICTDAANCKAGTAASGNGALNAPTSIAVDQDSGDLYVSDRENNRIDVYSGDGTFLRAFGFDVVDPTSPQDNTGTGYEVCNVAEHPTDICKAGTAAASPGTGQFSSAAVPGGYGLALSAPDSNPATGTLYLANSGAHRIESFNLDGSSPAKIGAANFEAGQPRKLALDSRGILYASNSKEGGELERYDSTGADGPLGFLAPIPVAANEIQRVTFTAFTEGESFTLTCPGGQTTTPIEYSPEAATRAFRIQSALTAKCAGGAFAVSEAPAPTVTFSGAFAATDVPQITCATASGLGTCKTTTPLSGHGGLLPGAPETATAGLATHTDTDGAGPDTDLLYVLRHPSAGPSVIQQFGPANQPGLTTPPTATDDVHGALAGFGEVFGLGLDDADHQLLVSAPSLGSIAAERVWVLGSPPQPPGVVVTAPLGPLDLTGTTATFKGTVTTDKVAASYDFEYSSDGGATWTRASEEDEVLPGDSSAHQVTASVTALEAHTTYQLRLIATKALGGGSAEAQTSFETPASIPVIAETRDTAIHDTDATLRASLNPENEATTYAFEYVTEAHFGTEGFSGAQSVPVPAASLPAGPKALEVNAHLTGLAPATTYRYRLHAANGAGPADGEVRTFTTFLAPGRTKPHRAPGDQPARQPSL